MLLLVGHSWWLVSGDIQFSEAADADKAGYNGDKGLWEFYQLEEEVEEYC